MSVGPSSPGPPTGRRRRRSPTTPKPDQLKREEPKPDQKVSDPSSKEKRLLRIGEAAKTLGVEPYVLRFWETQFPFLRPRHAASSHRLYEAKDVELLRLVKRLLHLEGYTIAGARKHIREVGLDKLRASMESKGQDEISPNNSSPSRRAPTAAPDQLRQALIEIRDELRTLMRALDN